MVKRIMVTLDDEQYEIIKKIKGFGTKDAEKIRNIIIAFLSEKSYLKSFQKE
ncbi:MAG: CopG family transcriptional regulator [Candidatus Bathyarchaeia archaeon]